MTATNEERWGMAATDDGSTAIWCRPDSNSVRLHLAGAIDLASRASVVAAGMTACLVSPMLEIDAENVDFIDAAGLGALIEVSEFARQEGCRVSLSSCSRALRRILELTDLEHVFVVRPEALEPC